MTAAARAKGLTEEMGKRQLAVLEGLDDFITDGTAAKMLDNILDAIAVEPRG